MGQLIVDGVWTLVCAGMPEKAVLDLPLDKFFLYQEAERRRGKSRRAQDVMDTAAAIAGVFGKDGINAYLKILNGA